MPAKKPRKAVAIASESDVRRSVRELLRTVGSIRPAAKRLGVSTSYFHDLARGRRRAGPSVLRKLGYRRVIEERLERVS